MSGLTKTEISETVFEIPIFYFDAHLLKAEFDKYNILSIGVPETKFFQGNKARGNFSRLESLRERN